MWHSNIRVQKMPKANWRTITVSKELYTKAEEFIKDFNRRQGGKIIRSMSHLAEQAIIYYLNEQKAKSAQKSE